MIVDSLERSNLATLRAGRGVRHSWSADAVLAVCEHAASVMIVMINTSLATVEEVIWKCVSCGSGEFVAVLL